MKHQKKKVLILYNRLFRYRIPIFNLLAERCDLTVTYSFPVSCEILEECNFNTIYTPVRRIWKFVVHRDSIYKLTKDYEVVVIYGEHSWIKYSTLALRRKRSFKLLSWTIGVPASVKREYGKASKVHYFLRDVFDKRVDGLIFYSKKPIEIHKHRGNINQKFFVAHNTVKIKRIDLEEERKNNILFIGSLYKEKGIDFLLEAYLSAYKINSNIPPLIIVGEGEEKNNLESWVIENRLTEKVTFLGGVYKEDKKADLFRQSIACISPLQAGLSVLESMGYGVPFITTVNATTGGEFFNIIDKFNGIVLSDISELEKVLVTITENRQGFIELGQNAFDYYWSYRTPKNMVDGLMEAIENV